MLLFEIQPIFHNIHIISGSFRVSDDYEYIGCKSDKNAQIKV